jgi:hypothetical protein
MFAGQSDALGTAAGDALDEPPRLKIELDGGNVPGYRAFKAALHMVADCAGQVSKGDLAGLTDGL